MKRTFEDKSARFKLTVTAELSWLRGNAAPYFSITGDGWDRGCEFGGCCHDEILKVWPDLAPLVALHLSSMDGSPMYALENGLYWLGGMKWQAFDADATARHFRITVEEATALHDLIAPEAGMGAQARLAPHVEAMRPRWAKEAADAIAQFGLVVVRS